MCFYCHNTYHPWEWQAVSPGGRQDVSRPAGRQCTPQAGGPQAPGGPGANGAAAQGALLPACGPLASAGGWGLPPAAQGPGGVCDLGRPGAIPTRGDGGMCPSLVASGRAGATRHARRSPERTSVRERRLRAQRRGLRLPDRQHPHRRHLWAGSPYREEAPSRGCRASVLVTMSPFQRIVSKAQCGFKKHTRNHSPLAR